MPTIEEEVKYIQRETRTPPNPQFFDDLPCQKCEALQRELASVKQAASQPQPKCPKCAASNLEMDRIRNRLKESESNHTGALLKLQNT